MRKILLLTAAVLLLFVGISYAHDSMKVEEGILPVESCHYGGFAGLPCLTYTVEKGDTLSLIAKRYSGKDRKLTVDMILSLPGNEYLKDRKLPENLEGYKGQPWNRKNIDWIFPGDKIVMPFVSMKDVDLKYWQDEAKKYQELYEQALKEELKIKNELRLAYVAMVGLLIVFVIFVVVSMIAEYKRHNKQPKP